MKAALRLLLLAISFFVLIPPFASLPTAQKCLQKKTRLCSTRPPSRDLAQVSDPTSSGNGSGSSRSTKSGQGFGKKSTRSHNLLVVGLGNPGSDYDGTRHNVGFAALDAFAVANKGILKSTSKFGADYGAIRIGNKNVGLLKPTTYINNSGKPLKAIMEHFKLQPADILVLADDVSLDCGDVKIKARASHGGHNGHRDIETILGTREYTRVRIGVGAPATRGDLVSHVLSSFSSSEQLHISTAVAACCNIITDWVSQDDLQFVIDKYNNGQKQA